MLEDKIKGAIKAGLLAAGFAAALSGCDEMNYCDSSDDDDYMRARVTQTTEYSSDSDGGMTYTQKNCGGQCEYVKEYDCCSCPESDDPGRDY